MKIAYLGHSCFMLTSENGTRVLTDPYTKVGYELPPTETDVVTISHSHFDHNAVSALSKYDIVANEAEKYVYGDVEIQGEKSYHDPKQGLLRGENIIFKIIGK